MVLRVFNFSSSSSECVVVIHRSFNLYCFKMTNDVEHLCTYICVSSFVKYLTIYLLKNLFFFFFFWSPIEFLLDIYMFWIQTFYQNMFCKFLSLQWCSCIFIFLSVSFQIIKTKYLIIFPPFGVFFGVFKFFV